ncbi:uncharacterized protein A4U43_C02F550 [Asparagus officinalis]|uniref:Uncharacterized protein n=1 Tax=Asparagus officinalis TaxID=4686 RepID=A0A5P1FER9_ASPOF|nr:uncharacterized protein A4U43_C02F550 [Asparagus officinalis]
MPSGEVGSQKMPSFLRSGGFHCPLDVSETSESGNLHPPLCTGDPGSGRFISASREDDSDSFEQSRKRKAVSTIRCLICRIDYENEEALELHCQSREHQKMCMDMVLRIQEGNVEKHRYPENATSFDDGNKSRKGSFKKCAIRK